MINTSVVVSTTYSAFIYLFIHVLSLFIHVFTLVCTSTMKIMLLLPSALCALCTCCEHSHPSTYLLTRLLAQATMHVYRKMPSSLATSDHVADLRASSFTGIARIGTKRDKKAQAANIQRWHTNSHLTVYCPATG